MSSRVYDKSEWQNIPDWEIVQKFAKGNALYVHPDVDLSQRLYRYMHFDQAVRMLADREMWFSAPERWEDPHEAWWCEHLFRDKSHLGTAYAYGTCWTRRWLDEPFWRLYGCKCETEPDPTAAPGRAVKVLPAVRFRARASTLLEWLLESVRGKAAKAYIGQVRYCPVEQLAHEARKIRATSKNASPTAAKGLHLKRKAFKFEDEVRMLWIDRDRKRPGHAIPFDPLTLFDQVMIGPTRVEHLDRYSHVEAALMSLGVPHSMIVPSSVFDPPDISSIRP